MFVATWFGPSRIRSATFRAAIVCGLPILIAVLSGGVAAASQAPGTKLATLKAPSPTRAFGHAVALSGATAVVGEENNPNTISPAVAGKAFVFTKTTAGWVRTATLEASNHTAGDTFGSAVAVSGSTIAVAGSTPGYPQCGCGRLYIFTKTGTRWVQSANIEDPGHDTTDGFGTAVATTGNTVYVGDPQYNRFGGGSVGAVLTWTKTSTGWSEAAPLIPAFSANYLTDVGYSLAASGNTIVSGTQGSPIVPSTAYVFTHTASGWTQQRLNTSDYRRGDGFGSGVSISGSEIAVGARLHGAFQGRVYVFARTTRGWKQTAELKRSGSLYYGWSVGISGRTLVTTASGTVSPLYFYSRNASGWKYVKTVKLTPPGNSAGI